MAKLILSVDDQVLKEIALSKERTTIGRKPHNDVQIDNLAVSGEHAVVVTIHSDCFLEDLGSTNGTQVNGKPVKKHFLQNNDVIELGKYKLKFVQDVAPKPAPAPSVEKADFEKTMVLRPSAMRAAAEQAKAMATAGQVGGGATAEAQRAAAVKQAAATAAAAGTADKDAKSPPAPAAAPSATQKLAAAPAAAAPATPPAAAPAAPAPAAPATPAPAAAPKPLVGAIQLLSGANAGKQLELAKPLTTLGRPGVQVAVLTRRPQGYFITHIEGTQQPIVNGAVIGVAPHALKDHDKIEIAGVKMEFFLKG